MRPVRTVCPRMVPWMPLACAVAALAAMFLLAGCTAVVVDEGPYYRPAPPPPPPAVIILPGETYGPPPVDRRRMNNRMNVCNANYTNCMASCNNFTNASQRALCINQCNAAMQQCRNRSMD